jgi:hypothetical protein
MFIEVEVVFFWKDKIDYNKIIMSSQNNLIIITGGANSAEPKCL